jgi:hypothetical protein
MFVRRTAELVVLGTALAASAFASDRLVTVGGGDFSATRDAVRAIEAGGGCAKIVIPPHFIIADIPEGREAGLLASGLVSGTHGGLADPADFVAYGGTARHIVAAWNNVFMGQARRVGLEADPSPDAKPLVNDIEMPPDKYARPLQPPGADYYDVSEFMLGTVAVGVILPESDGTIDPETEDWTQEEMDQVASEIISGLNWLVTKAGWRELAFYVVFDYQVPTGYEPIAGPATDQQLWANQCFTALGYGSSYPGHPYVNALRDSLGTDWGMCVFVIDSSNDGDGMFTDGWFGYAIPGGPKIVMTYDNDGWGIANMDAVLAHETCHVFYALDEHIAAGRPCTETSGYQAIENQNSMYPSGCATNVIYCIMRGEPLASGRLCFYSKGQIGWNDTDNDSIPDILDTFPETTLPPYLPDPDTTQIPTYSGTAALTALANVNPWGSGHDITLNRIAKVEWRVDGSPWYDATPTDGDWGGATEDFYFTSAPLVNGQHIFEARAYHTYGNVDPTPGIDTLTIDRTSGVAPRVTAADISIENRPNPFGSRVEITYSLPGEYGKSVHASIRVYDVGGRQVANLLEGSRSPGADRLSWDGTHMGGGPAPSGIYFIELTAGDSRVVKKLALTR